MRIFFILVAGLLCAFPRVFHGAIGIDWLAAVFGRRYWWTGRWRAVRLAGATWGCPAPRPLSVVIGSGRFDAVSQYRRSCRVDVARGRNHRGDVRLPDVLDGEPNGVAFRVFSPERGGYGDFDLSDRRLAGGIVATLLSAQAVRTALRLRAGVHRDERVARDRARGDWLRVVSQTRFGLCPRPADVN